MLYFSAERLIRNNIKKGIVMELHNSQKATNYIYIQTHMRLKSLKHACTVRVNSCNHMHADNCMNTADDDL